MATQASLPIKEAGQKKNSEKVEPSLSSRDIKDTRLARELQKAKGRYPTAGSEIEALVRQDIDTADQVQQELDQEKAVNSQQDATIQKVNRVNQQQTSTINDLQKQVSTVAQKAPRPTTAAPAVSKTTPAITPEKSLPAMPTPIYISAPEQMPEKDQEIYNRVKELEQQLSKKIDAMASWNQVAANDSGASAEL